MRRVGISVLKILAFLGLWALLMGLVVAVAVGLGGQDFYERLTFRVGVEIALTFATLAPLVFMALVVDKRGLATLGFGLKRLFDLLTGTSIGAAIFTLPLGVLAASCAARLAPDLADFSVGALALGLVICFFNVVTQEALVRSYMFQELWAKYGAWIATMATTVVFVALHAAALMQGTQGLVAGANILLASLMLSLAYVRTGELWLPIGLHLGWNGLQGPVLGINVTGRDVSEGHWSVFTMAPGDALLGGGAMGVEGGLIGLIGPAVGIALVALLYKQQPKPRFA